MAQTSVALVGDSFFLCGPRGNNVADTPSQDFRQQFQHPSHIHHTYVALGEGESYFIQFFDDRSRGYHITWSLSAYYPGLDKYLRKNNQRKFACVALGENGHYLFRDDWGSAWCLPESIENRPELELDNNPDPVVKLWLGKDDAYYAEKRSGASLWNFRGNYGPLNQTVKYSTSDVQILGMNLEDDRSYFIRFMDGRTQGNAGSSVSGLTLAKFRAWCDRL
ncbi:hypothetical protein F4680DRAFT_441898 [Xylaria scruposa]|nr:hypothetical protein F4680DRAFT_441898 [Xylaria scruposa]